MLFIQSAIALLPLYLGGWQICDNSVHKLFINITKQKTKHVYDALLKLDNHNSALKRLESLYSSL